MPDNETWETCPECGRYRQVATVPGLLHRTRICEECFADTDRMRARADAEEAEARALAERDEEPC